MTSLYLVAEIYPHPDKHDQAHAALKKLVEATQKENGCEMYELVQEQDSGSWFMIEKWSSKADWELHMTTDHVKEIQETSGEFLIKPADLRLFEPIS